MIDKKVNLLTGLVALAISIPSSVLFENSPIRPLPFIFGIATFSLLVFVLIEGYYVLEKEGLATTAGPKFGSDKISRLAQDEIKKHVASEAFFNASLAELAQNNTTHMWPLLLLLLSLGDPLFLQLYPFQIGKASPQIVLWIWCKVALYNKMLNAGSFGAR